MNTQLLETLATFLESFPKDQIENNKFNLSGWMVSNEYASREFDDKPQIKESDNPFSSINDENYNIVEPNYCQTVGCAMGWATTIPEFKELGLFLITSALALNETEIHYKSRYGMRAVQKFFDFQDVDTASILFSPDYYNPKDITNPLIVAKRIRLLIKIDEVIFNRIDF